MEKKHNKTFNKCQLKFIKLQHRFIRHIYAHVSKDDYKQITWNFGSPFFIKSSGEISTAKIIGLVDSIRNNFGVDLTLDSKKDKIIKVLDKTINENKFKNKKYNDFINRIELFNYNKLLKRVACFFFVTGLVSYDEEEEKYFFHIPEDSMFFKVEHPSYYNKDNKFYQLLFTKSLCSTKFFKSVAKNFKSITTLSDKRYFKNKTITFNTMYQNQVLERIKGFEKFINSAEVLSILKTVYEYKENVKKLRTQEELKKTGDIASKFLELNTSLLNGDKESASKIIKNIFNIPNAKDIKKYDFRGTLIGDLIKVMTGKFVPYDVLEKKYITKELLEKNYITKELLEKNYVTKELLENKYITKEDVEKKYISKEDVEKDYVKKSELEKKYIEQDKKIKELQKYFLLKKFK